MKRADQQAPMLPGHDGRTRVRTSAIKRAFTSGVIPFLSLVCVVVLCCGVLAIRDWPRESAQAAQQVVLPLQAPGGAKLPTLQLGMDKTLFYEQVGGIYMVSTQGGKAHRINTPHYHYNRAIPAIVISPQQILYNANDQGIWQTDALTGQASQVVVQPQQQAITSFVVSQDGRMLAWSSEPSDGAGEARVYAGPLQKTVQVYASSATHCPCFRPYAFAHNSDTTLLLSNDRGDHRAVDFGLWSLDLSAGSRGQPRVILADSALQMPLALAPDGSGLLYSTFAGNVPFPETGGLPSDVQSLNYANDMLLASSNSGQTTLGNARVILPIQNNPSLPFDEYHWVNSPRFSPDGSALVYVQFSSSGSAPFARYNAVYVAALHGNGSTVPGARSVSRLLATATTGYVEFGCWLSDSIISFYAGGSLYALDIYSGAITKVVQTYAYARALAVE